MKMYVISDNVDTRTGMRLAGIEGCVAHGEARYVPRSTARWRTSRLLFCS